MTSSACECGVVRDQPSGRLGCRECGALCCRSCVIEIEANPYCRWCAASMAARR